MRSSTLKTNVSEAKREEVELYYTRATILQRISASLFDFFISVIVGFLLLILTLYIVPKIPAVASNIDMRYQLSISSELYIDEDGEAIRLDDYLDSQDLSLDEKSSFLDSRLTDFFSDEDFISDGISIYQEMKEEASYDSQKMFTPDYQRALINDDYDEVYFNFYLDSYSEATGYLFNNISYSLASRQILLAYIIAIAITFLIPILFFFCIVPLFFKRTRQTFGMKISKVAIIDADGLALKTGKYIGRAVFFFLIDVCLSLIAFLLPLAVSLGMLVLTKSHQTLHDYVFNTYGVDCRNSKIYYDYQEYLNDKNEKPIISLEDENYKPAIKK